MLFIYILTKNIRHKIVAQCRVKEIYQKHFIIQFEKTGKKLGHNILIYLL